eukprot:CAMPEP_0119485894 /NCGR_PEP_ID=MMETSP1344-20130328/12455_1 /TAXON_ID=236787 /ORGANISM="Florenciella parvula, Strain CCMP2471" /LENGTH=86 /DNA_ID=CAMNT_0007520599 /DNA_START=59 /DNA_END=316 /DNA_ORIENTATION=-
MAIFSSDTVPISTRNSPTAPIIGNPSRANRTAQFCRLATMVGSGVPTNTIDSSWSTAAPVACTISEVGSPKRERSEKKLHLPAPPL